MSKTKEWYMEEQEKKSEAGFDESLEQEHTEMLHPTYVKGCYKCYKENRLIKAHNTVNDPFSFENVIKTVGNINKTIYGKNPYENR